MAQQLFGNLFVGLVCLLVANSIQLGHSVETPATTTAAAAPKQSWLLTCAQVFMAAEKDSVESAYNLLPRETHEKIDWLMREPCANKLEFAYKKKVVAKFHELGQFSEQKCSQEELAKFKGFESKGNDLNENILNYVDYCENQQVQLCARLQSGQIEAEVAKFLAAAEGNEEADLKLAQLEEEVFEFGVGEAKAIWTLHPDMPIEDEHFEEAQRRVFEEAGSKQEEEQEEEGKPVASEHKAFTKEQMHQFCQRVVKALDEPVSKAFKVFVRQQDFYMASSAMGDVALHWIAKYRVCTKMLERP